MLIRNLLSPTRQQLGGNAEEFLRGLGGPAWIRLQGRDRTRTRAVTTLVHGNEPSGIRALYAYLASGMQPATDVIALVASVDAALAPPAFTHRMLPGRRDLNRCFVGGGSSAEERLARAILEGLRAARPESLIDLHNTSGSGPAYGVGTRAGPPQLALTSAFASLFVQTDLRLGALMEATEDEFPTVTVECGGARSSRSDDVAAEGLRRYLGSENLSELARSAPPVTLFRHPVRVKLVNGATIAFAGAPDPAHPVTVREDVDRFNSSVLEPAEPIAWMRHLDTLTATDGQGRERVHEFFEVRDGRLHARQRLRLFMATTDAGMATGDCLFYATFPEEPVHGG